MWALSPSRQTLVCFVLGLFLFSNKLDSWDSFNTKPTSAGLNLSPFSRIAGKFTEAPCRFTQRHDRITDTFNPRSHCEQN